MEITLIGCFAILCAVIVFWRPLAVFRHEVPDAMADGIKHGRKILRINIMEDDVALNKRAKKIKEERDKADWVDVDSLWDSMHPNDE